MSSSNVGSSMDICDRIQIDDNIKERAKQIALEVVHSMPAGCKKACMAGALFAACEEAHEPFGLKDIHRIANGVSRKHIFKAKEFIRTKMKLNLLRSDGTSYLDRFCTSLGLGVKEKEEAEKALENLKKIEDNHIPRLHAAAIAYLMHTIASDNLISAFGHDLFIEIGDIAKLEPSTVRDFYKEKVFPRLSMIVPASVIKTSRT